MSKATLNNIAVFVGGDFRPSISDLRLDWLRTRAILEERSASMVTLVRISSDCEFAAAAWQNKLRSWCRDLDGMLSEYPAVGEQKAATRDAGPGSPLTANADRRQPMQQP